MGSPAAAPQATQVGSGENKACDRPAALGPGQGLLAGKGLSETASTSCLPHAVLGHPPSCSLWSPVQIPESFWGHADTAPATLTMGQGPRSSALNKCDITSTSVGSAPTVGSSEPSCRIKTRTVQRLVSL